jgi:hypothetical protein
MPQKRSAERMIISGADPGKSGAIVVVDSVAKMGMFCKLKYNKMGLLEADKPQAMLDAMPPQRIYLEKVNINKGIKWSISSAYAFGAAYGQLKYFVANTSYPFANITPAQWQEFCHQGIDKKLKPKERSMVAYNSLYPHKPIPVGRTGKTHDGVIDALLIVTAAFHSLGVLPDQWTIEEWK